MFGLQGLWSELSVKCGIPYGCAIDWYLDNYFCSVYN